MQNVDVEEIHDERRDVDFLLSKMSKTMQMSMLTKTVDVARDGRLEDADLVVERCVDEVVPKMVMSHCGGVVSLMESREDPGLTGALLPCWIPRASDQESDGCSGWVDSDVVG